MKILYFLLLIIISGCGNRDISLDEKIIEEEVVSNDYPSIEDNQKDVDIESEKVLFDEKFSESLENKEDNSAIASNENINSEENEEVKEKNIPNEIESKDKNNTKENAKKESSSSKNLDKGKEKPKENIKDENSKEKDNSAKNNIKEESNIKNEETVDNSKDDESISEEKPKSYPYIFKKEIGLIKGRYAYWFTDWNEAVMWAEDVWYGSDYETFVFLTENLGYERYGIEKRFTEEYGMITEVYFTN